MIFKKIYTFLNDRLNGNKFSKSFLVSVFITSFLCNILLFTSELNAIVPLPSKANKSSPVIPTTAPPEKVNIMLENIQKPSTSSYVTNAGIKNHILYQKTGLPDARIYTSYFPPSGTYNSNTTTEHPLPPCLNNVDINSIGKDCMIKIPFDCDTASRPFGVSPNEGVNCLKYSNIFGENSTKKLKPHKCTGARNTNKVNCINPELEYCHQNIDNPIIGINCKLAPCNYIPNDKYRRPGINCMADCNQSAGKHISNDIFFIEGFNCLPSCKTLTTSPKIIGVNCVLEFNDYVMPSCNNNFQNDFYLSRSNTDSRNQCLDVIDLPLCSKPIDSSKEIELVNCVKECNFSLTRHGIDCINFNTSPTERSSFGGSINKKCHHYDDLSLLQNATCEKIDCHSLSHNELKNSLNEFDSSLPGFSTQKFCKTSKYSNFSVNQIISITSGAGANKYLKEYTLPNKPCYAEGDSEEIETVLSNAFFKNDLTYPSKLDSLKNHCKSATSLNCTDNKLNPAHADFDISLLYDSLSYCTHTNSSQQISCADYRSNTGLRPYDCNSKSFSSSCPDPSDPSCSTICATGELYCFKNSLNCNSSKNSIYPVCTAVNTNTSKDDNEDPYVSWFFRPTLSYASYRQPSGAGGDISLVNMTGDPISTTPLAGKPNDDLYMTMDNVDANGYIDSVGTAYGGFSPGGGANWSIRGAGTQYICGMNSDYRGIPSDDFAYIKGDVKTVYELDNKVSHNVQVCIRYVASNGLIKSCGYRKCEVTCTGRVVIFGHQFEGSCTKVCGHDECKTLSIKEGPGVPAGGCESSYDNFRSDLGGKDCVSGFKTDGDLMSAHVRARIYKPEGNSEYICAVFDFKGVTTDMQTSPYFDGAEFFTVPDPDKKGSTKKLCVSGTYNETSKSCDYGVDSNSDATNVDVWRTAKVVKYISSPIYDYNYIDQYGIGPTSLHSLHTDNETGLEVNQTIGRVNFNIKRYFETSDCIRHKSRISGPVYFSEPTIIESERLFLPQIQINKICSIATGTVNCIENVEPNKEPETDFFKPAIEILYGAVDVLYPPSNIASRLSATNVKVIQINDATLEKSENYTIFARNIGIATAEDITKTVFIKKENHGLQPKLCLYETFGSGDTLKETLIRCVNRKKPKNAEINPNVPLVYNQLNFNAKFLKNSTSEHISINDALLLNKPFIFTSIINNPKEISALKKCDQIPGQGFPLCIQREECSLLNNECVTNEKELIDAKNTSPLNYQLIATKETVSNYCKNDLLPRCNLKKGFELTLSNRTLNTSSVAGVGFNAPALGNNYGWFNEVCIVSGLESLDVPVYVEELIPESGSGAGKCNRYSADRAVCSANCDNLTNCTKGADCCKIYSLSSPENVNKRIATPRELGFCRDINLYLNTCPAISFVGQINLADPYFISAGYLDPVHQSHINRHSASNHAEFGVAYEGNNGVQGKCVGFYKNKIDAIYPTANCGNSGWNISAEACKLNSCPARKLGLTNDADILGKYPSSYDTSVSSKGSLRGSNEGFANWESRDISSYLKENVTSSSCIAGYRKNGSFARKNPINAGSPDLSTKISNYRATLGANDFISSLYGTISGYTGGNIPERKCNQLGKWEEVTNPCQRITCPPITIEDPVEAGAVNMNDYDLAAISIRSIKIIYSLRSPFSPAGLSNPPKIKIITGSSAQPAPVYFNLFATSTNIATFGAHDLIIKNSNGSNASLEANTSYVLQQTVGTPNYWKIMPNPNDEVLRALWIKSGGARFPSGAYAYRSPTNLYTQDALDTSDIHEVTGECNASMGFSQVASELPKITCDSNGNWTRLRNICISSCGAVNQANANDISHGFSTWDEVRNIKVGEAREVDSTGCYSPSYKKYSYPPLFDSEGVRRDFFVTPTIYNTEDTYDAIVSSIDGANFTVNSPAQAGVDLTDSDSNQQGTYYNFKVSNSGLSSSLVSSPYSSINPLNVFYLFDDSQTLSISAPADNVWSKINFSSYGTPSYGDFKESKINCHSDYSKLILASKCIGKTNCTLTLSDFETYNATTCPAFSLGNGSNGSTTTNSDLGSSGGGGGGNIAGSGGGLTNPINVNGSSGSSYYDKSFHLTPPILSDGNNKGLKVDLTSASSSQFNGGNGSVQIEESPNSEFNPSELTTFVNVGEYTHEVDLNHTIRIAGSDDVYVRYVLVGGGGGGGGAGLNKGTNGASGTQMTGGVFIVKRGTQLKIHVGGGGGAGKTKCARTLSNLDPRYINPAIEILEPEKETNFVVKALKGIGSLIVSEGWAQDYSLANYKCEVYRGEVNGYEPPVRYFNYLGKSYPDYSKPINYLLEVTCNTTGYTGSTFLYCASNFKPYPNPPCTCANGYMRVDGNSNSPCTQYCTVNSKTGFGTRYLSLGSSGSSVNCDAGYTGKVTYSGCTSANLSINPTGTCTPITACNIASGNGHLAFNILATDDRTGADAQNLNGGRSITVNCQNTGGYSGVSALFSCNDSGSLTAGNCPCATNYSRADSTANTPCTCSEGFYQTAPGAVCNPITCSSSGDSVGTGNTNLPYTDSSYTPKRTVSCISPYFGNAEYTCTNSTPSSTTGIFTITSACSACVNGYRGVTYCPYTWSCEPPYDGYNYWFCRDSNYGQVNYTTGFNAYSNLSGQARRDTERYCSFLCTENSCTLSAGVGYNAISNVSGAGSITCKTGYRNGSTPPTYYCGSNGANVEATVSGTCEVNSCTLNAGTGYITDTTVYGSATSISCNAPGYSGTITYSCAENLASINPSANNCTANSCASIETGNGYSNVEVSATATISCSLAGYAGSVQATCSSNEGVAGVTGNCTCAEGYYQTEPGAVCNPITCSSSGVSVGTGNTNLPYTDSSYTTRRTVKCVSPYSGNAEYTCTASTPPSSTTGIFTITSACYCIDGYSMVSGVCTANSCASIETGNGYSNVEVSATATISCSLAGYAGSVQATCSSNEGVAGVTGNCTCAEGYYQTEPGAVCNPITCTANGTGYSNKTGLSYTLGTSTGTFDCDEDYYGTVSYRCSGGDALTRAATIIASSCEKVTCPLPPNSNLTGASVDFAKNSTSYNCASGYRKQDSIDFSTLQPNYTCTKNIESDRQFNPSQLITSDECVRIKCYSYAVEYDFSDTSTTKTCTSPDKWGTEIYTCNSQGIINFTQNCNSVYCPVPSGRNIFYEDDNFPYSGDNFININCEQGYYYKDCPADQTSNCGRPQFKCVKPAVPSDAEPGVLTLTGACLRTRCLLPTEGVDTLNSSSDGTMVEWNGPNFVNLTCKNGFYQSDPALPPQYSCSGNNQEFGNLVTLNKCLPITCSIPAQTGIFAKNNLIFGDSKIINCDKSGFSGTLTYNCRASVPLTGIGTSTIVSNNCTETSCTTSANNGITFENFVSINSQLGGLGGSILTSTFLKGGQGGSASNDFVNGSGGGGGSASMIAINKRIIAIAGGGGGGGGGGNLENNNEAVTKKTNLDLSYTLNSNIYGKYFVGEMQFNPIQSLDPTKTTGLIKAQNASNIFDLSIPTGMYVNDVIFASFGNPTIDFSGNNLILKKGSSCHDANSIAVAEAQCLSKKTCSFDTNSASTFLNSACRPANTNFGMIASYYFQEPTLFVNKINSSPSSSQIENLTFRLKQYDARTSTYTPASDLINNKIYSFKLQSDNVWIKDEYTNDEYFISDANSNSEIIKVSFHRTNTSFSPTLKTGAIKRTLVRPANTSLSVGFIKVGKQYILRKSGIGRSNWTIREFGDEEVSALNEPDKKLPQRTCMTKQISSLGTVGVLWSRPNNMCTNVCPGAKLNPIETGDDKVFDEMEKYDLSDQKSYYLVGDDRIGVGVTKHDLSDGIYYTYWEDQTLNSWQIRKFRKLDYKTRIGSNRRLLITQSGNSINSSNYKKDSGSDDRNSVDKEFFILARKCDSSGQWEAPIALCSTEGSTSDPNQAPSSTDNSFFENIYDREFGSIEKKYVRQSNSNLQSKCLDGFLRQTTSHEYFSSATNIVSAPIYQCTTKPGGKLDEVYFKKVDGHACKKYCYIGDLTSNQQAGFKISVPDKLNGKYVRPASDTLDATAPVATSTGSIEVECQAGKFPRLITKTMDPSYGLDYSIRMWEIFAGKETTYDYQVRSTDKPKIICVRDPVTGALSWQKDPTFQCYDGRTCYYNSLTPSDGIDIPRFIKSTKCNYTFDSKYSPNFLPKHCGNYSRSIGVGEKCPQPTPPPHGSPCKLESSEPSYDSGLQDVWFTLNKYITKTHQTSGLEHGLQENFNGTPKCGYVISYFGLSDRCVSFDRKYLQSYSCNDGTWVAVWNNLDGNYHSSCNGTGDSCNLDAVNETQVPATEYLGGKTSDKSVMFNRKNSLFPNPKGSCDTCIGNAP